MWSARRTRVEAIERGSRAHRTARTLGRAGLRREHRLRCARHASSSSPTLRRQLQRSLVRSHAAGSGAAVETEVVRALMLLRLATLATGRTGVRLSRPPRRTPRMLERAASRRSCPSTARSAARATSRRSRTARSRSWARARSHDARRALACPPPRRSPPPGSSRSSSRRRRASRSSTAPTACSACSSLAIADLRDLAKVADISAAMSVEALLGTDRVYGARAAGAAAASRAGRLGAQHRAAARGLGDHRLARDRRRRACRTRTRSAARRRSRARCATRSPMPRTVALRELASAIDNPVVLPDGRDREQRQLPRRAGGVRARLPRDRRCRPRVDERAADRPDARPGPLARVAAVPRRTTRASTRVT